MRNHIKMGMYVRCSIELEHLDAPRRFALGQVVKVVNDDAVEVCFFMLDDLNELHDVYQVPIKQEYRQSDIYREYILNDTKAKLKSNSSDVVILAYSRENPLNERMYFVSVVEFGKKRIIEISESELKVPFNRGDVDVRTQLYQYEFHNPVWYFNRQTVTNSLYTLKNATFGFETLIGSRVYLLEHQVDTIVRVLGEERCRFMLADEVGLGKTIEASVIMKGLTNRFGDLKTLVIVPNSLLLQWRNELSYKFWMDFTVFDENDSSTMSASKLLFPLEAIHTPYGEKVISMSWDLCMVDETHRLLRLDKEYKRIKHLSERIDHLLLLSATPIQSREKEFYQLLTLLEPMKYEAMKTSDFQTLLNKQEFLRKRVYRIMRDLPDYIEEDLAEDCIADIDEICNQIGDATLTNYVKEIKIDAPDKGLSQVKFALAYIGENYQIERKIIRHRRKEIESNMAKRRLELVSYPMSGADTAFYEEDAYQALLVYLSSISQHNDNMAHGNGKIYHVWLGAVFSSPNALLSLVQERKTVLQGLAGSGFKYLPEYPVFPSEAQRIQEIETIATKWQKAVNDELSRVKELYDDPDLIKGRYLKVIDYILSETDSEKIVLFSNYKETLLPLEKHLKELLGDRTVRGFYFGMNPAELQQSVDDFQNDEECRLMFCDPLGGEGRNFQMADRLIHLDLPWSPVDLEQRIGRLDRIGRTKDVLSVVFYSESTLEEDLLAIWKDGLKLFEESLSGIEIAVSDIQEKITEALSTDILYGMRILTSSMNEMLKTMRDRVEEERYYDMTRQLDEHVSKQLGKLIEKFNDEGGERLAKTMMAWSSMTGLNGIAGDSGQSVVFRSDKASINSMKRTLFVLPDTKEALRRAKRIGEVRGTFKRDVAVSREAYVFFAPGDPFFDSIVNNAYETDWGRCAAIEVKQAPIDWEGLVFTWSVEVNPVPLLSLGETLEQLMHAQGYTPLDHFRSVECFTGETDLDSVVLEYLANTQRHQIVHKGQRSNGRINQFIEDFPSDIWKGLVDHSYLQSREKAVKYIGTHLDIDRAQDDFIRLLNARKAASIYYGNEWLEKKEVSRLEHVYHAILQGLQDPVLRLESAVYVRMMKSDG
ncbi:SNF2-related protein [Paenibacillus lautus]|uniref:Helicase n=1 Tax=Paenibacillus lautus TaxID=1401 RepID=A0A385TYD5_PAELA|nr:SNF2-related protein [Paenibacillus lautus]AYB46275.1 hypothetical protein D5F53_24570 [Paenibacillus lautus]